MAGSGHPATPGKSPSTSARAAVLPSSAQEGNHPLRHVVLFLIGADVVALFIYLLLVPTDAWEGIETRLQSMGTLVKSLGSVASSVIAYFGLKRSLRTYLLSAATIFDEMYFALLVGMATVVVWAAVLPLWKVELRFYPPQPMPPRVELGEKARTLIETRSNHSQESSYVLEGLLLRSYDLQIEGAREALNLPLITVLKGSLFSRAVIVQLPCTLEVSPIVPHAEVYLLRVGQKQEEKWGLFPDDGKLKVMPGSYQYIRVTDGKQDVRTSLTMECPVTKLEIGWN